MKKLLIALFAVLLVGCAGYQPVGTVFNEECSLYQTYGATSENSLIASVISNPCTAKRILGTLVKLPAVQWEGSYTTAFNIWADRIESAIGAGISPKALQDLVIAEVAKLNKKVGMTIMILSDGLLVFKEDQIFLPKDREMLLALIGYLKDQVHMMELLA